MKLKIKNYKRRKPFRFFLFFIYFGSTFPISSLRCSPSVCARSASRRTSHLPTTTSPTHMNRTLKQTELTQQRPPPAFHKFPDFKRCALLVTTCDQHKGWEAVKKKIRYYYYNIRTTRRLRQKPTNPTNPYPIHPHPSLYNLHKITTTTDFFFFLTGIRSIREMIWDNMDH
ncbi:hypothetical protein B0F90DRAFT_1349367 [Multifurca ochricompacta]|uniref:Uncharacterized protein n=1 Tax=Multifurca ochricompacta TaxID=376703 RepID=A0AAD4QKE7_9AGAM|nr:hypothetical protein B0F90DRAFT_1349367 [Multifurca ochricompacta]